ncbi:MAG TPA: c-type cytochrome biogenesis protein CcmI [Burkholderiaceae bacterium]|nr:c-type cytochrome biogenesis protein CcmI [Burkholderiaceae bacterium]
MTMFWLIAAMFLGGALLIVLPALWRPAAAARGGQAGAALAVHRDHWVEVERDVAADRLSGDVLAAARQEIERRAREEALGPGMIATPSQTPPWRLAFALGVVLPVASVALYLALGHPASIARGDAAVDAHRAGPDQAAARVARLLERVKAKPDDVDGWTLLGRAYVAVQRYRDAVLALRRAVDLAPDNAHLIADLADVTAMLQGRRFAGEPVRLIQRALDADPQHVKSLALAGSAAFEAQDYAAARGYWQRALARLPADAPAAHSLRGSLAEAAKLSGDPSAPATEAGSAARIAGEVVLSPALRQQLSGAATLFVFARAAEGPRQPLAILRRSAALPASFTLDDSMAMSPQLRLSTFPRVVVGARLSRSGNATPQPGDLVGQSEPVAPGTTGLRILIDRVQP